MPLHLGTTYNIDPHEPRFLFKARKGDKKQNPFRKGRGYCFELENIVGVTSRSMSQPYASEVDYQPSQTIRKKKSTFRSNGEQNNTAARTRTWNPVLRWPKDDL